MKDFFISYNKADREWAEWIAWQLDEGGYSTILQAWDFRPGSNFVDQMQRAVTEAGRTIAVLSPDYLAAEFPQPEWQAAFAKDSTGAKGSLLLVRVRDCETEGLLSQIVRIDLDNLDEAASKQALLDGVKRGRAKPDAKPAHPGSSSGMITSKPHFPGAMPSIWNVPHLRNLNFTGREEELSQLRASLLAGETAALVQAQAIHGLGGVGKTQLAVEYAYRNRADYDAVWWVRSEDPSTLASDYARLASEVDLPEKDETELRVIVEAVKRWLRKSRGWLLIFDNAEDVELVRDYILRGSAGSIIVTSRNPAWTSVAASLPVKALPLAEAVEFLLKRTGHQDEETAKKLAEALGRLPLALEQAGAYIETSGCTMPHYLHLFEERKVELLRRSKPSTEYRENVTTTWSISFQSVEKENPAASELLRLCAFFAPDDIPIWMLAAGSEDMPESLSAMATDAMALDEALMALRRYSLVEVANETISIHRLVQAVIRHAMDDETLKQWTRAAVHVVNTSFPEKSSDVRTWPICLSLLPHASAALSHADAIQLASGETSRLLNQVGLLLNARAEYPQAKVMLERAVAISEAALGPNHPNMAIRLNNLGLVLKEQGDLAGAKALLERALAIDEAALGPNHPAVAIDLNNLGSVLQDQGDLAGAKALLERALAIDEATLGPNHPKVAIRLNNLGGVLSAQGDLAGAKALFERALAISEAALGPNHPEVAIGLNNLGSVLQDQGDLAGAKALFERALAIDEAALGPNHPDVAIDLNNLGGVLKTQGDLAGAKTLLERALAIDEAALGPNHPGVATDLNNLGLLLRDQGDLAGAEALSQRSLRIFRESLGDDHPTTKTVEENLRLLKEHRKNRSSERQ